MGITVLEIAKQARDIFLKPRRTVEQKRALMAFLFSNPKINDKNVEVSYQKASNSYMIKYNKSFREKARKNHFRTAEIADK